MSIVLSVVAAKARNVFYLDPTGSYSTSAVASMARYVFSS
jgi:hypothetical protein